jgi:hypothetical protein
MVSIDVSQWNGGGPRTGRAAEEPIRGPTGWATLDRPKLCLRGQRLIAHEGRGAYDRFRPIADMRRLAEYGLVKFSLLLALAFAPQAPSDRPRTYLASVEGIALGPQESLADFELNTWGVRFRAVCRIPSGWRIEAGGNATPEGSLKGQGTHGATWLNRKGIGELRNLALVTLDGPVRPVDARVQNGIVPATFKGKANIYGRRVRAIKLSNANVRLSPATRCP